MKNVLLFSLILLFFTLGCMATPRNGQELQRIQDVVNFTGLVPVKEAQVVVWCLDEEGEIFGTCATFESSSEPHADYAGWYAWGGPRAIYHPTRWLQVPGERKLMVRMKAQVRPDEEKPFDRRDLTTFDEIREPHPTEANAFINLTDQCIEEHKGNGIQAIINNCQSPESPIVTLYVPCGAAGQNCCQTVPSCSPGLVCSQPDALCEAQTLEFAPWVTETIQ